MAWRVVTQGKSQKRGKACRCFQCLELVSSLPSSSQGCRRLRAENLHCQTLPALRTARELVMIRWTAHTVINSSKQSAAQQEAFITEGSASSQRHSGSSNPAEPIRSGHCCSPHAAPSGPGFSAGMVHTRLQHAQQSTQLSRRAFIQFTEKRRPPYGPPSLRLQPEVSGGLKCIHPSFITFPHIM